jgi:hypothetical protein
MLFYRAALDLSRSVREFVANLIRGHRLRGGSRWRRLPPAAWHCWCWCTCDATRPNWDVDEEYCQDSNPTTCG